MFEFKFNINEINAVLASLAKMPFEQVADLIKNIHGQAQPQMERVKVEMEAANAAKSVDDAKQEPGQEAA